MHIEQLTLQHRALLDRNLKQMGQGLSDYSFANLYLFRNTHNHELIFENNEIFVRGKTYDGFTYIMPTRNIHEIDIKLIKSMLQYADFLFPIPQKSTDHFTGDEFGQSFNQDESDYIFDISKMVTYAGNKLHKKHNLLNQFVQGYEHHAYPLIPEQINFAREILEQWQDTSAEDKQNTDYFACLEALELNEQLVLCGMIYYVGKEPAGFVLGEELTEEMFDLKFVKAKKKFKGIYQYLYNDFAKLLPKKYRYFNFEEDLGTQSLRMAKSSYNPCCKLLKYRISSR
jgi:uncharacterized protein